MNIKELMQLLDSLGIQKLTQRGHNIMGCCPAHAESRPSWGISVEPPHYHGCFSCGFKGTLATMLVYRFKYDRAQIDQLDLQINEAVDLELSTQKVKPAFEIPAYNWYMYAPKQAMWDYLRKRGLKKSALADVPLSYDTKQERVLFGWFNHEKLQGITGRRTDNEKIAKTLPYANTKKGQTLYMPRTFIESSEPLILVEGEIDALKVYQASYTNVAALGFGLITEAQKSLILNSVDELVLFLDDDFAGHRIAESAVEMFQGHLRLKKVVRYQGCKDAGEMTSTQIIHALEALKPVTRSLHFTLA